MSPSLEQVRLSLYGLLGCLARKSHRRSSTSKQSVMRERLAGDAYGHTADRTDSQNFRIKGTGSIVNLEAIGYLARQAGRDGQGGVGYMDYDATAPHGVIPMRAKVAEPLR